MRISLRLPVCSPAAPRGQRQQASKTFFQVWVCCADTNHLGLRLLFSVCGYKYGCSRFSHLSGQRCGIPTFSPITGKISAQAFSSFQRRWAEMSLFWSAVLLTANIRRVGLLCFFFFVSACLFGNKKQQRSVLISSIQTHMHVWSLKQVIISASMLFLPAFSKDIGRREAPSATRSHCYLTLGPFSHKRGGTLSKGTKCLTVDDEPAGRWLTPAWDITPDICDDSRTISTARGETSKGPCAS